MEDATALGGDSIHGSGLAGSPPSDSSSANVGGDTVDEDEDVCRICRNSTEPGNPLRYPCACRGTIKYVHQECLLQWLNRRKISRCEVFLRLVHILILGSDCVSVSEMKELLSLRVVSALDAVFGRAFRVSVRYCKLSVM